MIVDTVDDAPIEEGFKSGITSVFGFIETDEESFIVSGIESTSFARVSTMRPQHLLGSRIPRQYSLPNPLWDDIP